MGFIRRFGAGAALVTGLIGGGATTALAEETIGEVIAQIDGEDFAWRAIGPDGSGTDYNTNLRAFGPMQTISVMGFPLDEVSLRGTIQLTLALMGDDRNTFEQEVIYAPEGMRNIWTSLAGEDLITVTDFAVADESADIAGSFSGRVCLKESLFAEPDTSTCKEIDGTFRSRLPIAAD